METGHWKLVIALGLSTAIYALGGGHFKPGWMILAVLLVLLGLVNVIQWPEIDGDE